MSATFRLDRAGGALFDAAGGRLDPATRTWPRRSGGAAASTDAVDALAAATWLQRESGHPVRVPIGVIGPREATDAQMAAAREVGAGLAACGFVVVCGGRHGVMQAVCEGVARNAGVSIGLLPDADPSLANPFVGVAIATGIGEARNALIARAALGLIVIGTSFGTLSEVALGRQFGKLVVGLQGAPDVEGVVHVRTPRAAIERMALLALGK